MNVVAKTTTHSVLKVAVTIKAERPLRRQLQRQWMRVVEGAIAIAAAAAAMYRVRCCNCRVGSQAESTRRPTRAILSG
jgi:hypothetical protein